MGRLNGKGYQLTRPLLFFATVQVIFSIVCLKYTRKINFNCFF